ncbi:MAG TPA: citrate/2-methylcitrate synthase [Acidimicrobiales bacterium]|jgi:citrate synthase
MGATLEVPPGLRGLEVADTQVGDVRGLEGFYHYGPYSAVELSIVRSFEDVWHLLLFGRLPDRDESTRFAARTAGQRALPASVLDLLRVVAASGVDPMTGLRTGLSHLAAVEGFRPSLDVDRSTLEDNAVRLAAAAPTIVATLHRLADGLAPLDPDPSLGHVADYLRMVTGSVPGHQEVRAIEQYLVLALDHGFNASTFTGRVVTSTGADLGAVVVAALGALSGPLHGGAPSRALEMLEDIGSADRAPAWVAEAVAGGDRIMGFGHAIYRTADPRSLALREVAVGLGGPTVELARDVEIEIERTLAELKPDRPLQANIEYYAGVVMDRCGLPRDLFTPTFAISRVVGWTAHALEQAESRTIIRPSAHYVGAPAPQPVPAL